MLDGYYKRFGRGSSFVVTSHARPDGDGIGSALACGQILRVMGKDAEVVMHDGVPRIYQNLPFADRAIQADTVPRTMPSSCWNATAPSARCSRVSTNVSSSISTITSAAAISPTSTGSIPR